MCAETEGKKRRDAIAIAGREGTRKVATQRSRCDSYPRVGDSKLAYTYENFG